MNFPVRRAAVCACFACFAVVLSDVLPIPLVLAFVTGCAPRQRRILSWLEYRYIVLQPPIQREDPTYLFHQPAEYRHRVVIFPFLSIVDILQH